MTTIEAMKLAATELESLIKGERRTLGLHEVAETLRASVKNEEAQSAEPIEFSQFLSDVMTAAGLVAHGKQSKVLGERLADGVAKLLTRPASPASSEREQLITSLRRNKTSLANTAADMLEADAAFKPDWATYRQGVEDGKAEKYADARVPMTEREIELIDGMIEVQLDHAKRCDAIHNRVMADKQHGWDMERVTLLQKLKAHHGITEQCYCDKQGIGELGVSCGDCPTRDYKIGEAK